MTDYPDIQLNEEDQRTLRKMNDDMLAVRQFIETVQLQGEQRLSQLQGTMRETWQKIEVKYGLDLKRVAYELDTTGTKLVATTVRLRD